MVTINFLTKAILGIARMEQIVAGFAKAMLALTNLVQKVQHIDPAHVATKIATSVATDMLTGSLDSEVKTELNKPVDVILEDAITFMTTSTPDTTGNVAGTSDSAQ